MPKEIQPRTTVTPTTCGKGTQKPDEPKTFLATYRPARGVIRVVIVKEEHGCQNFFCTEANATPREIIEAFADRAAIDQGFHDVKEVWGAGQQQVRNIWTNIAVFNLNLWVRTLVECWAWKRPVESIRDRRDSPWDDANRRPSHAARLTPTVAKPCAARLRGMNTRRSRPRTVARQEFAHSTIDSFDSPHDYPNFSESAD